MAELAAMTEEERKRTLAELVDEAKKPVTEEQRRAIRHRLHNFELEFGFTTGEMYRRLACGDLGETARVNEWMWVATIAERLDPSPKKEGQEP